MKQNSELLFVLKKVVLSARLLTAGLLFTIAGAVAFGLFPPLVLEHIINRLAAGIPTGFSLILLYFAVLAASGLFNAGKEVLITVFGQKITRGLRHEMCAKLSRLPASYFVRNDPGVTSSRFVNDVDTVEALFASGIISMAADTCSVASILAVIFFKSRGLGILMLLVTPLLFLLTRRFQRQMLKAQTANRRAVGDVTNHVPETIKNIRSIHVFHKEAYMEKVYGDHLKKSYQAVETSNFYDAIYSPIIITVSAAVIAVIMVLSAMGGGMRSFFGMSVGTAVAVISYVGKVFDPLESIGMEIQNIQSAVAGVSRINEFLGEKERCPSDSAVTFEHLVSSGQPAVVMEHVDFGYAPGQPVFSDLSFTVRAGETATLTGRTGCGKSTVFKLLLGLYLPDNGRVLIYGTDAGKIPDSIKRRLFGYVEQSFRLIPGTMEDQITLGDPYITHEAAVNAARMAGIHDSILALADGYATECTMQLLSQGQMQLLAVARAVAANPPILLLDEITANLDSDTEAKVMAALQSAAQNRTVISISHRLYESNGGRRIPVGVD